MELTPICACQRRFLKRLGRCIVCKTYNLSLATLGAIILALSPLVELTLALLDHFGIHGLLELFEDLRVVVV